MFSATAASYYGAVTFAPDSLMFVKAYGARNIAISIAAIWLLTGRHHGALSKMLFAVVLIPLADACIVYEYVGTGFVKHLLYVPAIAALAWFAKGLASHPHRARDTETNSIFMGYV